WCTESIIRPSTTGAAILRPVRPNAPRERPRSNRAEKRSRSGYERGLFRGRRESLREPEGKRGRAVCLIVREPFPRLGDGRTMPGGYPPQAVTRFSHLLEPLPPIAEHELVSRLVSELEQALDRFPHRHVHDDERVVRPRNLGGIAGIRLQSPD